MAAHLGQLDGIEILAVAYPAGCGHEYRLSPSTAAQVYYLALTGEHHGIAPYVGQCVLAGSFVA